MSKPNLEANKATIQCPNLSDVDEDFVSCQICFLNFDEKERVPKYLDGCHHFFCLSCIRSLVGFARGKRKIACPVCRFPSLVNKGKCEDLTTNQVALRLLEVLEEHHQTPIKRGSKESEILWCNECFIPVTKNCLQNEHKTENYSGFLNSIGIFVKLKNDQTLMICDQALKDYEEIQSYHKVILGWIQQLQLDIARREVTCTGAISRLKSLKNAESCSLSTGFENAGSAVSRIKLIMTRSDDRLHEAKEIHCMARELMASYTSAQKKSFMSIPSSSNEQSSPNLLEWFKSLDSVNNVDDTCQSRKLDVEMLTFLSTLFTNEQTNFLKPCLTNITTVPGTTSELDPNPSCSGVRQTLKRPIEDSTDKAVATPKRGRGRPPNNPKTNQAACSNVQEATASSSSLPNTPKCIIVAKKQQTRCFFCLKIGDQQTGKVVFQVNSDIAPNMASKFVDFVTGNSHPSYAGTELFLDMMRDTGLPEFKGGQIIDRENLLFIADSSRLPLKVGSVHFTAKEVNHWGTVVSPEFEILLAEPRQTQSAVNTVFGEVVEGISMLQGLTATLPVNQSVRVTITACGVE